MSKLKNPVSVIVPAFNEALTITDALTKIHQVLSNNFINFEIIVVNDGSTDGTEKIVSSNKNVNLINHKNNRGYGASLKTGIKKSKHDLVVIIDSDGTYPASAIPEIVRQSSDFEMVVGSRTGSFVKIPLLRRPAKYFIKKLAEYVTSRHIEDLNSGLRCFRKSHALKYLHLLPDKFSFTTTLTVAMLSDGYEIGYVEIDYFERKGKSKIRALDFFNFTSLIIKLSAYFNPLRTFFPIGFLLMLLSFSKFVFDIYDNIYNSGINGFDLLRTKTVSATSILLFISGLQIILFGLMSDALIKRQN